MSTRAGRKASVWDDFKINPEKKEDRRLDKPDGRTRNSFSRATPSILADAVAQEDPTERWNKLEAYRKANPARCALKSWDFFVRSVMGFDAVV